MSVFYLVSDVSRKHARFLTESRSCLLLLRQQRCHRSIFGDPEQTITSLPKSLKLYQALSGTCSSSSCLESFIFAQSYRDNERKLRLDEMEWMKRLSVDIPPFLGSQSRGLRQAGNCSIRSRRRSCWVAVKVHEIVRRGPSTHHKIE